jgi:hypothetical protein
MKRYRQKEGVSATEVDDDIFLVATETEEVFHLNPLAAGIWRALAEPSHRDEIIALLHAAFPERDAAEVARDAGVALDRLVAEGFVISVP